jgi:hypothetical protein
MNRSIQDRVTRNKNESKKAFRARKAFRQGGDPVCPERVSRRFAYKGRNVGMDEVLPWLK